MILPFSRDTVFIFRVTCCNYNLQIDRKVIENIALNEGDEDKRVTKIYGCEDDVEVPVYNSELSRIGTADMTLEDYINGNFPEQQNPEMVYSIETVTCDGSANNTSCCSTAAANMMSCQQVGIYQASLNITSALESPRCKTSEKLFSTVYEIGWMCVLLYRYALVH